jgi:hypothetical protein
MLEDAKKELEKIEYRNRTFKSKVFREQSILMDIIMEINSHTGKKQQFWGKVRDLYDAKYCNDI